MCSGRSRSRRRLGICRAVNLEGMRYGQRWPIAGFIAAEYDSPSLIEFASSVADASAIWVHLTRDAWTRRRVDIIDRDWNLLFRRPLSTLSPVIWADAVEKATRCLATRRGRYRREPVHL